MNGLKILKSFFKKLDVFGFQFCFDYKFNKKYRTALGGIVFMICLIFMIIFFIINLKDFINRTKWNVLSYTTQISDTDSISFTNYSSVFAFGLSCGYLNEDELNNLFTFESKYKKYTRNNGDINREKLDVNFEKCKKSDFYNKFDSEFETLGLDSLYCLATEGYNMEGVYSSEIFSFFEITLYANLTNSNTTNEEEITNKKKLIMNTLNSNECQISFYYIRNVIDINNYKQPVTQYINSNFISLRPDDISKINIYFKLNQVNLDNDWFFNNYKRNYYISAEEFERYSEFKGLDRFESGVDESDEFAKLFIRAGTSRSIVFRNYQKLFELISTMASFFMVIIFIFTTFLNYYDCYFAYNSILKNFFRISDNSHHESKEICKSLLKFVDNWDLQDKTVSELNKSSVTKDNRYNINERQKLKIKNKYEKKGVDILSIKISKKPVDQKKRNLNYIRQVVLQYMFPICNFNKGFANEKLRTIENNFFLKMDIRSYIKTSQLIDLFNYLILSEGRCEIMNFISNPCVLFNNIDALNSINTDIKTYYNIDQEKITVFLRRLSELKNKTNKSTLDDKFLHLIFSQLKSLVTT